MPLLYFPSNLGLILNTKQANQVTHWPICLSKYCQLVFTLPVPSVFNLPTCSSIIDLVSIYFSNIKCGIVASLQMLLYFSVCHKHGNCSHTSNSCFFSP